MAVLFLDSSALIKRYVQERGTQRIRSLAEPSAGHQIYVARLAILEVVATLIRQSRTGNLSNAQASVAIDQLRHAFAHEFRVIELTATLTSHALNHIQNHGLRGADALHLAAATELDRRRVANSLPRLTFLSADTELNEAARAEGLSVEDPNDFP